MRCSDHYERETLGSYLPDQKLERRLFWQIRLHTWLLRPMGLFCGLIMNRLVRLFWLGASKPISELPARSYSEIIQSGGPVSARRRAVGFISTIMRVFIIVMLISYVVGMILS